MLHTKFLEKVHELTLSVREGIPRDQHGLLAGSSGNVCCPPCARRFAALTAVEEYIVVVEATLRKAVNDAE